MIPTSHVRDLFRAICLGLSSLCCLKSVVAEESDFASVSTIITQVCLDCHNATTQEGAVDLERFRSLADVDQNRSLWKTVFDVVESRQMPLAKSGYTLTDGERDQLLGFIRRVLATPTKTLGCVDPGKPILRRLTRLEYNNTVRDLMGLEIDIFMFPERLPISEKGYFTHADQQMGAVLQTSMREYGQKYDVLLPQLGLPGDNRAEYGFSNRGDALNLSPLLFEKYMEMAAAIAFSERLQRESPVLRSLLGLEETSVIKAATISTESDNLVSLSGQFANRNRLGQQSDAAAEQYSSFVQQLTSAYEHGSGGTFDVPSTLNNRTIASKGDLLKLRLGAEILTINPNIDIWLAAFSTVQETSGEHLLTNRNKGEKRFELTFGSQGGGLEIIQLGVCALARRNQQGTVRLSVVFSNGKAIEHSEEISEARGNLFFSWTAPKGDRIVKLVVDGTDYSGDYVLLDDLGFIVRDAPRQSQAASLSQKADLPSQPTLSPPSTAAMPERVLNFLTRAYRRPITSEELKAALTFIADMQAKGDTEAISLKRWLQSILVSPDFLFRSEPVHEDGSAVRPVEPFELANRLSYFLWASMPDDILLQAAKDKELSDTERLKSQVRRMLRKRSHSRELSESFAVQWLRLDQLFSSQPDRKLFDNFYSGPQGKTTLHGEMMTEPLLLFETVLVEDRSIVELYATDHTWLNPQLANWYGLQESFGEALAAAQRSGATSAELPQKNMNRHWVWTRLPNSTRGGVMTMAGPLTLTSLPFRTSPIKRGAWLLESIFNRPPNEPKVAFVLDEIADRAGTKPSESMTVRQKFELHRNQPNCNSCHSRIDPPGFALEVFNAVGSERALEGTHVVDATGTWNGVDFRGPAEFKSILLDSKEELIRGFAEHLLSYALGRKLEHFDMQAIDRIVTESAARQYSFTSIVEGIALSYPFQHIRNQK
jgi:hypothetical protein